ncbi:MAG: TIGR00645 family protein [Sphingomonas sp.]
MRLSGDKFEIILERWLFASRWLLAPFYVALILVVGILFAIFVRILWSKLLSQLFVIDFDLVILHVLSLIDVVLAANLVVIVILAGYENFVSRFEKMNKSDRPTWMGNISFAGLKLKLFSSIVAISGIQLLKAFLAIGQPNAFAPISLFWFTVIHLTFVTSTVLFALTDRYSDHPPGPLAEPEPEKPDQANSTPLGKAP